MKAKRHENRCKKDSSLGSKSEAKGQIPTCFLPLQVFIPFIHPVNLVQSPETFYQYHQIHQNNPNHQDGQLSSATHLHHLSTWVVVGLQSIVATEAIMGAPGKFTGCLLIKCYSGTPLISHHLVHKAVIPVAVSRIWPPCSVLRGNIDLCQGALSPRSIGPYPFIPIWESMRYNMAIKSFLCRYAPEAQYVRTWCLINGKMCRHSTKHLLEQLKYKFLERWKCEKPITQ